MQFPVLFRNYAKIIRIYVTKSDLGEDLLPFHKISQEHIWSQVVEEWIDDYVHLAARAHKCAHIRWMTFHAYTSDISIALLGDISE